MENTSLKYKAFGDPLNELNLCQDAVHPLDPNEVLVEMISSPINPSDLIPIRGAYSHRISLPCIGGYEGVGRIVKVGNQVSPSLINQRVLPLRGKVHGKNL
ncbi:alcohol dehydrogenase catalytic domain-containing protein [Salibacterium halotolerans]|uniref:Alcohol dehydrogenase GroES-like domain-containing protein n=1 Tax=Salibacterium halotolerans TaxID=1884432 RepID=A0A1I5YB64_9BACI|nr:alcohol dehydrogenase catalytic domain-containing protein [Salibacterium halotolerans]SFQ41462.1 Alcohol dehydrogenase GroES-like domain-containing protein [Salibacterium halotolerans]